MKDQLRGGPIPGVPDLLARLDLVVETDEAVTVTDWKTAQAEDSAEQLLLLYSELVRRLLPGKRIQLEFAVITKAARPVAERLPATYAPSRIERAGQITARVWQPIEAEHLYPAPWPVACGYCPFRGP